MAGGFGIIREKIEIKILLLFILRRLPDSVGYDELVGLTMCDDGIGYFDFADCLAELVSTGHVNINDGKYSLTPKGVRNGEITEVSLPHSVRVKAEQLTAGFRAAVNRDTMIKTQHTVNPDGSCTVSMAMSDGVGEILSLEMFAANERQGMKLERGFRKEAEEIYKTLMKMLNREQ